PVGNIHSAHNSYACVHHKYFVMQPSPKIKISAANQRLKKAEMNSRTADFLNEAPRQALRSIPIDQQINVHPALGRLLQSLQHHATRCIIIIDVNLQVYMLPCGMNATNQFPKKFLATTYQAGVVVGNEVC